MGETFTFLGPTGGVYNSFVYAVD